MTTDRILRKPSMNLCLYCHLLLVINLTIEPILLKLARENNHYEQSQNKMGKQINITKKYFK